jgi:hypothetical protein
LALLDRLIADAYGYDYLCGERRLCMAASQPSATAAPNKQPGSIDDYGSHCSIPAIFVIFTPVDIFLLVYLIQIVRHPLAYCVLPFKSALFSRHGHHGIQYYFLGPAPALKLINPFFILLGDWI